MHEADSRENARRSRSSVHEDTWSVGKRSNENMFIRINVKMLISLLLSYTGHTDER